MVALGVRLLSTVRQCMIKKCKNVFQVHDSSLSSTTSLRSHMRNERMRCHFKKLNSSKASPINSIPARILKENSDVFSAVIQNLYNYGLSKVIFPKELKAGDIKVRPKTM